MPQLLEHETKAKCNKAKAAPASTSGTLRPSTTGHGPGMPIDVDGPADAATTALAAALDAALAATATQQSGNSGADSKRKHRELGPAVELPGVPPAASLGAAPTAPPNTPPRKKKRGQRGGDEDDDDDDDDEPTFVLERQEEAWAQEWCR